MSGLGYTFNVELEINEEEMEKCEHTAGGYTVVQYSINDMQSQ